VGDRGRDKIVTGERRNKEGKSRVPGDKVLKKNTGEGPCSLEKMGEKRIRGDTVANESMN